LGWYEKIGIPPNISEFAGLIFTKFAVIVEAYLR